MSSFLKGFEKRAIDLATARKAVQGIKPNLIRRGIKVDAQRGARSFAHQGPGLQSLGPAAALHVPEIPNTVPSNMHRKIFAKGDTGALVKPLQSSKAITTPEHKEMLNRSMLLHEQFERQATKRQATIWGHSGHANPSVILKENNAVATMPKSMAPVKDLHKELRTNDGSKPALEKGIPGFQYGEKRYSRHAIKRMGESMDRQGMGAKPMVQEYQKAVAQQTERAQRTKQFREKFQAGLKASSANIPSLKKMPQASSTAAPAAKLEKLKSYFRRINGTPQQ